MAFGVIGRVIGVIDRFDSMMLAYRVVLIGNENAQAEHHTDECCEECEKEYGKRGFCTLLVYQSVLSCQTLPHDEPDDETYHAEENDAATGHSGNCVFQVSD